VLKKADAALAEAKKAGGLSAETKKSVDEALTGINVLREQLADIEQKMARKPGAGGDEVKSYGEQVAKSDRSPPSRPAATAAASASRST
jgi:hypothetical protein